MKIARLGIALIAGLIAVGGSSLTTYLILQNNEEPITIPQPPLPEPLTSQEIFVSKLLSGSLNITDLNATITNVQNSDLVLNFNGVLDYDILSLLSNDFSSLKGSGALTIKWQGLNEAIAFNFTDENTLYFTVRGRNYSIKTNTLEKLPHYLAMVGLDLSSLLSSFDISNLIPPGLEEDPMALLSTMAETKNLNGFTYRMLIPNLATLIFNSDLEGNLTSISTASPIVIDGSQISLRATCLAGGDYGHLEIKAPGGELDNTTNIFTTIARIQESGKFRGDFKLSLSADEEIPYVNFNSINLEGSIKASVYKENDSFDFNAGIYELLVNPIKENEGLVDGVLNNQNRLAYLYKNNTSYFVVNNLVKGQVSNQAAKDIFDTINKHSDSDFITDALDEIDDIIKSTPIFDLINGDFTRINDLVTSFSMHNNIAEVSINQDMFGLGDNIFKVLLDLNGNEGIKSIAVSNFKYSTITLNFELTLKEYDGYSGIFMGCEDFQDFSNAKNIYDSLANFVNSGTYDVSIDGSLHNSTNSTTYPFGSNLKADISNFNPNHDDATNSNYGDYALDFATEIDGKSHAITGAVIDHTIYTKYNDLKYSIKDKSIDDLIKWIDLKLAGGPSVNVDFNDLLSDLDVTPLEDILSNIEDTLASLGDVANELVTALQNGDLGILEDYVVIFNTHSADSLSIGIRPYGDETLLIATVNSNNGTINNIDIQNLRMGDYTLNFVLTINEFKGVFIDNPDTYAQLDDLTSGLMKFVDKEQYKMTIDASLQNTSGEITKISSPGIQTDFINDEYYGEMTINAKFMLDNPKMSPYNHTIKFDTINAVDPISSESYKDLRLLYNNRMLVKMGTNTLEDVLATLNAVEKGSAAYDMLSFMRNMEFNMPLTDIIDGDLTLLNNKYITDFRLDSNSLELTLDLSLVGMSGILPLHIDYDAEGFKSVIITNGVMDGSIINATIGFFDFDHDLEANRLSHQSEAGKVAIDLNCLNALMQFGINTINTTQFNFSGKFQLRFNCTANALILKINGTADYYYWLTVQMNILQTGAVEVYMSLQQCAGVNNAEPIVSTANNYYGTEFFFTTYGDVLVKNTSNARSSSNTNETVTYFKVTMGEFTKNIPYYLFKLGIKFDVRLAALLGAIEVQNLYNTIVEQVANSTANPIAFNYENIINSFSYDENARRLSMVLAGKQMINLDEGNPMPDDGNMEVCNFGIDIYHDANYNLTRLYLSGKETVSSLNTIIAKINITSVVSATVGVSLILDLNARAIDTNFMANYYSIVSRWETSPKVGGLNYYTHDFTNISYVPPGSQYKYTGSYNTSSPNRNASLFDI